MDTFPYYPTTPGMGRLKRVRQANTQYEVGMSSGLGATIGRPLRRPRIRQPLTQAERVPAATIGQPLPTSPLKLPQVQQCQKCGAHKLGFETANFCCGNGTIELPHNKYPSELIRLYTGNTDDALHFQTYARLYNNLFAFSSIGGDFDAQTHKGTMEMHDKDDRQISCREYYCYKLQNRPSNMMLRAGRCFQQYVVDMYVKIENTRLDFFRNNQDTIRAELYQGILDTVDAGECCVANVGRRVILPPTYIGGPCDMKKRYLNAMALVQKYGKPDLFITMTCNANWPEIQERLAPGELSQNRPDLVARVFRAKLLALKKKITEGQVFGEVAAFIYVVEFQKRGLPHAHFLIILKPAYKMKGTTDYDKFVSAEIPPPSCAALHASVLKHMMHGPCGELNRECSCMNHKNTMGRCKYNYPKSFTDETTNNSEGYPVYRRRDDGQRPVIRKITLDNRWVIPYNPYLLSLFDCHLNVEVCSTIEAVKYLYKYVYKGHDKISYNVVSRDNETTVDEIARYQSGRWVSPCEAMWRIFGFDLFETQPPVMPLPIHLPNMQSVQLRPEENLQSVIANEKRARTPLTEFFRESSKQGAEKLLYGEFTTKYRWDKGEKRWIKRRKKLIMIGILVFVAPSEGERYFLRLLLLHIRGPKSFEYLKTVDGYKCATFQEAAVRCRLIEEDDTVNLCLNEACEVQMPSALRRLFATVLIFCQPKDPTALWEKYYSELSQDFKHKFPSQPEKVNYLTASSLEQCLEAMGKSLRVFNLDHLLDSNDETVRRTKDIIDALDAPIPQDCIDCRSKLNPGQQEAFDNIIAHVREGKPGAFFIDGPGGTGKTFLYNALYAEVRLMGKIVLPTATSGIAASNIPSGRTAHSRFKIPLNEDGSLSCDIPKQGSLAALIRECSLIIWDEASMAKKSNVEALDLLLRDLCHPNLPFGGKLVVFGGDFRQVLPIIPHKSQREAIEAILVNSVMWPTFIKFRLVENMRAREDPAYSSFLLALGNGELQTDENQYVELPREIVRESGCSGPDPINEITSVAFPELDLRDFSSDIFTTRAILTPINDDVDAINSVLITKFPGAAVTYKSFDTMLDDKCNIYPAEFVNNLCPGGMSPHELILKENCPVILLRNILPSFGLCNGTRLICKIFFPNLIECMITTGHNKGERVLIPRIKLRPSPSTNYPFQFQRNQFPLKLSFAMTINKSQGQTLSQVAIYLPKPCFSHGQLYVALSRARTAKQVTVISSTPPEFLPNNYVRNVVSYDVLRLADVIT